MGKARRKRGLIAIEAIRGTDIDDLVKRYKLSAKRIRKAVKSGLEANGLPNDTREALREGLSQLREKPDRAIERIRRRAGLAVSGSSGKSSAKSGQSAQASKQSGATAQKKQTPSAPDSGEDELPTRLKNLLLDTEYSADGEIDRAAVAGASVEKLQELPGCGKASAEKILAWAQGK